MVGASWWKVTHPRRVYSNWRHWRKYPQVGDVILYHGEPVIVTGVHETDDVEISNGEIVSWMHCCDPG